MIIFFRNTLILLSLFTLILIGVNTYSLNVTHREFLFSMKNNPQHAYFYITPQAKEKVTIEDMSSYKDLANSFDQTDYQKPPMTLVRKRTVKTDLDPMDKQNKEMGKVIIVYVFEKGRWVIANLNINQQSDVAVE